MVEAIKEIVFLVDARAGQYAIDTNTSFGQYRIDNKIKTLEMKRQLHIYRSKLFPFYFKESWT